MVLSGSSVLCLCMYAVILSVMAQDLVNIALGKTYSQISLYDDTRPASHAANNNTRTTYDQNNCTRTDADSYGKPVPYNRYHWWEVDLGRKYPVQDIIIWTEWYNKLAPFIITVDNQLCFNEERPPLGLSTVTCPSLIYGQVVRLSLVQTNQQLRLCEFQIFVPSGISNCSVGHYGDDCQQNCSDNCGGGPGNNFCYQDTGVCYGGCPSGYHGDQCTSPCSSLSSRCTQCSQDGTCTACSGLFMAPNCTDCVSGKHGAECNESCSSISPRCTQCSQDGACTDCTGGGLLVSITSQFTGPNCTDCLDGYHRYLSLQGIEFPAFDDMCYLCSCYENTPCNKTDGGCQKCPPGKKGHSCKEECDNKTYGQNCSETCGQCKGGQPCETRTGSCTTGCEPGYSRHLCKTGCDNKTYGENCSESCGQCKGEQPCDTVTGNCTTGCQSGYTGWLCQTPCENKTYGENCSESCGQCKGGQPCDTVTGSCTTGCEPGYTEQLCKAKCQEGRYGDGCSRPCGYCRVNTTCHHQHGRCPGGCGKGYTEPFCSQVTEKDSLVAPLVGSVIGAAVIFGIAVVGAVCWYRRSRGGPAAKHDMMATVRDPGSTDNGTTTSMPDHQAPLPPIPQEDTTYYEIAVTTNTDDAGRPPSLEMTSYYSEANASSGNHGYDNNVI